MIHPAADRTLDFAALRRALSREGLRPGRMVIVADGVVERDGFRIDGWPEPIALAAPHPPGGARLRATVVLQGDRPKLRPTG